MRTTSLIALLLVTGAAGVGAFLLAGHSTAAPAVPAGAKAWEYKVLYAVEIPRMGGPPAEKGAHSATSGLNTLGAEGWDLVAVDNSPHEATKYVFKRPK
jgi:hypothetical protein